MSDPQAELLRAEAIRNLENYRAGRRHVVVMMITIAIVDILGIIYLMYGYGLPRELMPRDPIAEREVPAEPPEPPDHAPPPPPEPTLPPETEPPELREPHRREVEFTHYVRWGDTFYTLARRYWDDEHLWPDLWSLNEERFPDPDFIAERDVVAIYPRLAPDGEFQEAELERLFEAYLRAYRAYQRVSEILFAESRRTGLSWQRKLARVKREKSKWLLYSALRFDEEYLERFAASIDEADLAVVRNYVERFGIPGRR